MAVTTQAVRILVVEDNMINQKVVQGMLKHFGYAADFAVHGEQALEALDQNDYDLIFMDVQMPVMDGYTATARIREREQVKGLPRMPIIAMTANAMEGDREVCLAAGMDDYLAKPIRPDILQQMIQSWQGK